MAVFDPILFFLLLGGMLIAIELIVLQAVVGWVFLAGVSALLTAGFLSVYTGFGWIASVVIFIAFQLVMLALLLKPILRWQSKKQVIPAQDMIGEIGEVSKVISPVKKGKVRWSGTEWDALLDSSARLDPIEVGHMVKIIKIDGITLYVVSES